LQKCEKGFFTHIEGIFYSPREVPGSQDKPLQYVDVAVTFIELPYLTTVSKPCPYFSFSFIHSQQTEVAGPTFVSVFNVLFNSRQCHATWLAARAGEREGLAGGSPASATRPGRSHSPELQPGFGRHAPELQSPRGGSRLCAPEIRQSAVSAGDPVDSPRRSCSQDRKMEAAAFILVNDGVGGSRLCRLQVLGAGPFPFGETVRGEEGEREQAPLVRARVPLVSRWVHI
jgi:hypothetical protein